MPEIVHSASLQETIERVLPSSGKILARAYARELDWACSPVPPLDPDDHLHRSLEKLPGRAIQKKGELRIESRSVILAELNKPILQS